MTLLSISGGLLNDQQLEPDDISDFTFQVTNTSIDVRLLQVTVTVLIVEGELLGSRTISVAPDQAVLPRLEPGATQDVTVSITTQNTVAGSKALKVSAVAERCEPVGDGAIEDLPFVVVPD